MGLMNRPRWSNSWCARVLWWVEMEKVLSRGSIGLVTDYGELAGDCVSGLPVTLPFADGNELAVPLGCLVDSPVECRWFRVQRVMVETIADDGQPIEESVPLQNALFALYDRGVAFHQATKLIAVGYTAHDGCERVRVAFKAAGAVMFSEMLVAMMRTCDRILVGRE